jgi:hypothetical protein
LSGYFWVFTFPSTVKLLAAFKVKETLAFGSSLILSFHINFFLILSKIIGRFIFYNILNINKNYTCQCVISGHYFQAESLDSQTIDFEATSNLIPPTLFFFFSFPPSFIYIYIYIYNNLILLRN